MKFQLRKKKTFDEYSSSELLNTGSNFGDLPATNHFQSLVSIKGFHFPDTYCEIIVSRLVIEVGQRKIVFIFARSKLIRQLGKYLRLLEYGNENLQLQHFLLVSMAGRGE